MRPEVGAGGLSLSPRSDIETLRRDRDQLFAEAFARYQHGAQWYLTPEEDTLAAVEQDERFEVDPWEEPVLTYCAGKAYITTRDLLTNCLGLEQLAHHTQAHTKRLGAILRRHKWQSNKPVWITTMTGDKKQTKAWKPPLVTYATGSTEASIETGNAATPSKNNDVTGVTGVTGGREEWENENRDLIKNSENNSLHPIWENAVTTGNKAKPVTDSPSLPHPSGTPTSHSLFSPLLPLPWYHLLDQYGWPVCSRCHPQPRARS